jgi:hypothetical protein
MAVVMRCYSGAQTGVHFFDGSYYEYAGFGSQAETDWFNDSRIFWKDNRTSAQVAAVKARVGV